MLGEKLLGDKKKVLSHRRAKEVLFQTALTRTILIVRNVSISIYTVYIDIHFL